MFKPTLMSAAIAAMIVISPAVSAQKLYKVVDDKGNVSYQDKPPVEAAKGEVVEKHIDRNVMKLRENAPKGGEKTFEEVEEIDPYTFKETEHRGGPLPPEAGELDGGELIGSDMEVPAEYREAARLERELSSQPTAEEVRERAKPVTTGKAVKKKKSRTLSADELNDIARNAGN